MRFSKQLQTLAVLAMGAVLGFVAASGDTPTRARAEAARPASLVTTEPVVKPPMAKAPCCDAKLDRTLAMTDAVAEANAVAIAQVEKATKAGKKPNILVIMGGRHRLLEREHRTTRAMMGYKTPNIDRIAKEGAMFTDWYGEQSCTAGRSALHHRTESASAPAT